MQEVVKLDTFISSLVGLVTLNTLLTFPFFIEIVPKSYNVSRAVKVFAATFPVLAGCDFVRLLAFNSLFSIDLLHHTKLVTPIIIIVIETSVVLFIRF